jgi:hypothetical protein
VTLGQIADVLMARGELDEALRIRREEELPVYERLKDVRLWAVTQGQIADVLMGRGEFDEALRINREEELPVYERLKDVHELVVVRTKIALSLLRRTNETDHNEALEHLRWAFQNAASRGYKEARQIAEILRKIGLRVNAAGQLERNDEQS